MAGPSQFVVDIEKGQTAKAVMPAIMTAAHSGAPPRQWTALVAAVARGAVQGSLCESNSSGVAHIQAVEEALDALGIKTCPRPYRRCAALATGGWRSTF